MAPTALSAMGRRNESRLATRKNVTRSTGTSNIYRNDDLSAIVPPIYRSMDGR
jgi:hypothetical protein